MIDFVAQKCNMVHIGNCFEARHEKGEHKGAHACIKTTLCTEEMKFMTHSPIQNEKFIVQWCSTLMAKETRR